ncbi:hypothetical protein F4823DRAFT_612221 [Ustulina deusta]|nr:hypothetical protein F4823DRAFT_612221 [Ustulina deusta]
MAGSRLGMWLFINHHQLQTGTATITRVSISISSCAHTKLVAQVFFLFFSSSFSSACLCNISEKRVSTIELVYTMVGLTRRLEIGSKSR